MSKLSALLFIFQWNLAHADLLDIHTQLTDEAQTRLAMSESTDTAQREQDLHIQIAELQNDLIALREMLRTTQVQILQLQDQIAAINQGQKPPEHQVRRDDWDFLFATGTIGSCRLSTRDEDGYFQITNSRDESIRFRPGQAHLNQINTHMAYLIGQGDQQFVEISQLPTENPQPSDQLMSAQIQYRVVEGRIQFGEVQFFGERIRDRSFGRSTHNPFRMICQTTFPGALIE